MLAYLIAKVLALDVSRESVLQRYLYESSFITFCLMFLQEKIQKFEGHIWAAVSESSQAKMVHLDSHDRPDTAGSCFICVWGFQLLL